jgi:AraC-like DNA-binding protein
MALIAVLLPDSVEREALHRAASAHELIYLDSWRELGMVIRRRPVTAAVVDPHAEPRKDGALRIFRLRESFPFTPVLAWGELDGRDLYRLGKAGAADVVLARDTTNREQVMEILRGILDRGTAHLIVDRLAHRLDGEALALVRHAAEEIPNRIQVPDLAAAHDASVSTLERRCERSGLPTPGRLLLWLRVLYGLRWLAEPGRSLESTADQLGYSSGAAFRRAIQATVGGREVGIRTEAAFHNGLDRFITECPGTIVHQPPHALV